jgi:hypothetical protein
MRSLIPVALVALPLLHAPVSVADDDGVDLTQYLCKDIMRMSDDERAVSIGVLHGYRLGTKGEKSFAPDELADITNRFIEYCLDNPHEKAMASFSKLAK